MSDAFIYFFIIGAGLTLGIATVIAPIYLIYQRKNKKYIPTKPRG